MAALVLQHRRDDALVNVDVIGVGASVFDHLRASLGEAVAGMNGSEGSDRHDKSGRLGFANKRAEWWWQMREVLDPASGKDLALPPDGGLLADLCAPTWKHTARGIQVESKEDIIKRLGRSPDRGDSAVYALARGRVSAPALCYDAARNGFTALPPRNSWHAVIGCALRADSVASAVVVWSDDLPSAYLAAESAGRLPLSELAAHLQRLVSAHMAHLVVMDCGPFEKTIADELRARYQLPLAAAEDVDRNAGVELLNDAIRRGRFFARPDGPFAAAAPRIEWDHSTPEHPKVVDPVGTGIWQAAACAYRTAPHWLHVPAPPPGPRHGTPEAMKAEQDEYERQLEMANEARKDPWGDAAWALSGEQWNEEWEAL